MNKVKLLVVGGIPDDNLAEVVRWTPQGIDLKFQGNSSLSVLMSSGGISAKEILHGGSRANQSMPLPSRPDVVFNAVCNAESCTRALDLVEGLCNKAADDGIPVFNHPEHIRKTSRRDSTKFFDGLDRILVPDPTCLESPTPDSIRSMFARGEIELPVIIRTATEHNGESMVRLVDAEQLDALNCLPFDGRDFYVIPYVDFKGEDGFYRKFRVVKVGDRVFPRHMLSSTDWNIHSTARNTGDSTSREHLEIEKRFLVDPEGFLGLELFGQLQAGLRATNLDYVAVDFSVLPDGQAVFFECNACFNAFTTTASPTPLPELREAEGNIRQALVDLVVSAARVPGPAGWRDLGV